MDEENKTVDEAAADKAFVDSLLNPHAEEIHATPDGTETEEQKAEALKKKNAEEAQKRREKEAKEKAEKEAKEKAEQEAKAEADAKAKAEAKKKAEDEARAKSESEQQNATQVLELSKQIADFKTKYPDVDIQKLQKDADFTEYLEGKLLRKKTFSELYANYSDYVKRVGGKDTAEIYGKNANKPSSGGSHTGDPTPTDIYSEEELKALNEKIPLMDDKKYDAVAAKLKRSIAYYDKK